jgi:hypothetical protein
MNKNNREKGDITPLSDGSYMDSQGNIRSRQNNKTHSSTKVEIEINGKRVYISQNVSNHGENISIRQEVHNSLRSAREELRKTRQELRGIHYQINDPFQCEDNFFTYLDSQIDDKDKSKIKVQTHKKKKDNWLVSQFKSLISHFIEHFADKKRIKQEVKDKALQDEQLKKLEQERYNKLSVEEKIQEKFNYFVEKLSVLDTIQNEASFDGLAVSKSIIHSLHNLKEDAISLTTFNNARLSQEAQSLVFQVLPNIIETYHTSMNFINADKASLSQKFDSGLAELSSSIHQLKNKHISSEQQASTQALDEAFQFAKNRFNENEDYADEMIKNAQTHEQKNTKKMTMK